MFVCVCFAVTEAQVDHAIASGAHTRAAVTGVCGAGGDCGSCHGMIETKIEDHLDQLAEHGCCPRSRQPAEGPTLVAAATLVRERAA